MAGILLAAVPDRSLFGGKVIGNSTMPITLVIMLPYMLPLIFSENAPVMRALSYIPIVSTVTMPIRQIMGEAQWWEALVSLAVLLVFTAGAIVLGAKIYSRSFLQTGKRLKVLQVLRNKA